jgi:hypothetical protein
MKKNLLVFVSTIVFIGIALIPLVQGNHTYRYIGLIEKEIRKEQRDNDIYTVVKARWLRVIPDESSPYTVKNGEEVWIDSELLRKIPTLSGGYFIWGTAAT